MSESAAEASKAQVPLIAWLSQVLSAAPEQPRAHLDRCGRDGCGNEVAGPFELFCRSSDGSGTLHLLPLADDRRSQTIAIYTLRAVYALLPLLAASTHSPIPLYVGAGIAGLLMLAVPLRRFAVAGLLAPVLWICAIGLAISIKEGLIGAAAVGDFELGLVLFVAATLLLAVLTHRDAEGNADLALLSVSSGLTLVLASAALCVAFALGFGGLPEAAPHMMLIGCISAAGGTCTTAIIAGLVRGARRVKHNREFKAPKELKPWPIRKPKQPRVGAQDTFARMIYGVLATAARIAGPIVDVANSTLAVLCRAIDAVVLKAARGVHFCKLWSVWVAKLLAAAVVDAIFTVGAAAFVVASAARHWLQTIVFGLALYAASGAAAVLACSLFSSYIGGATLLDGLASLLLALVALCALAAIWWALTRWPAGHVANSALHTTEVAGPILFLTLVALGWIDGIVGLLGYGPLRPGWLTIGGTIVLALVLAVAYLNNRNEDEPRAEQDAPA